MNQIRSALAVAIICSGLFFAFSTRAATMTEVPRSTWAGSVTLPSYVKMYIYVPDKLATNPPIVVSSHSCGSSASAQMGNMKKFQAMADKNGFIIIIPDNPGQNCWDVGSKKAMTHDGGGDPHAVAQMVRYALTKYKGDLNRVYAVGGSSGGMMTQALLGIYPEIFVAGAPRAGVPCGCWAEKYDSTKQWSNSCAGGTVIKTAEQWGDYVRAINPTYTGHRPRVQLFQGESDETISYKNMGESIKEWTNVLGLSTTPTSTDQITSSGYNYGRQFWKNKCGYTVLEAWSAPGQKHSMTYEEDAILKFFGLDVVGGQDPELAACGSSSTIRTNRAAENHNLFFVKEKTLIMNAMQADEASIKIIDVSGRIRYNGNHRISNNASISVPLSFLHSGYYISSVEYYQKNKRINRYNIQFILKN